MSNMLCTFLSFPHCACSHAVNLLNNLPVSCLDVLIDVPVQGGQETYGGKNMDAVQKLLDFMEKRLDKVKLVLCNTYTENFFSYTYRLERKG